MLRFSFWISFLFLFTVHNTIAQNRWYPGYIIDNEGDTTFGFIEYAGSRANATSCRFRVQYDGDTKEFSPYELSAYRIENSKYFISKDIGNEEASRAVFLEFLIEGKANVYHYVEDIFYLEVDSSLYELKNTEQTVTVGGQTYLKERKEYLGILSFALKETDIEKDIRNTSLTSRSLINTAKKYHEKVCKDEICIIYERKIEPLRVRVGAQAGMSLHRLTFGGKLASSFSPGILVGALFEFENISNWTDQLSLGIDPMLLFFNNTTLKPIGDYIIPIEYEGERYRLVSRDLPGSSDQSEIDVNLKIVALNLPFRVNYSFKHKKSRTYLGAGIINMFVLSQNKDFILTSFHDYYGRSVPTYHVGAVLGIGHRFILPNTGMLSVEGGYQYTSNLDINQIMRLQTHVISITAGYRF